jgi:hypothetical protein
MGRLSIAAFILPSLPYRLPIYLLRSHVTISPHPYPGHLIGNGIDVRM